MRERREILRPMRRSRGTRPRSYRGMRTMMLRVLNRDRLAAGIFQPPPMRRSMMEPCSTKKLPICRHMPGQQDVGFATRPHGGYSGYERAMMRP